MTDPAQPDQRARELLAAAGISPSDDEMVVFEMMYPILRARADTVYSIEQGYDA